MFFYKSVFYVCSFAKNIVAFFKIAFSCSARDKAFLRLFTSSIKSLTVTFLLLSLVIVSFRWKAIFQYLHLKTYKNIQRVHNDEVSRLGGFLIYLFLWIIYFLVYVEVLIKDLLHVSDFLVNDFWF